jgi:PmbA protein
MNHSIDELSVATSALETAVRAGAEAADVYLRTASQLDMELHNGEIENLRRARSCGLGLRVSVGRRTALVHTTDVSPGSLESLAVKGVEVARSLPEPSEPTVFARPQHVPSMPHPDPDLRTEAIETKRARLVAMESAMTSVPGVSHSVGVAWSESDGVLALANSRGLRLRRPFCSIEANAECVAEKGEQSSSGGRHIWADSRAHVPDLEALGREAGTRAVDLLGARPIPSTRAPVIFTPQTGWTLPVYLVQPLRGDHVVRGRSYLAGSIGETVAAPEVTVRDNPLRPEGPVRRMFDAEGSPTRDLALVENGVLASYLTDLSSAAKLGVPCGGNANRDSYDSRIEIGTTNLYMEPGPHSPDDILRATERGLMVTVLSGWWLGLSPVTDTYSSAAMGFWIEDGEIVHPVRGVSIGATLRDMLKSIDMIGNDLVFTAPTTTPTFRVAEMAISGT